jgi:hypothetical protein
MTQLKLELKVAIAKEVNGLEMGVLSDGRSYLSARTLAKLCGVVPSAVITQAANWKAGRRDGRLAQMLREAGIEELYAPISDQLHAYHEDACMVFVEYYAFEAREQNAQALNTFRKLGRAGLRVFVYAQLGYDPANRVPLKWQQFHDRMTLHSVPIGYFSIFKEISDFVVAAINADLPVDDHTIPDISVGMTWGKHWEDSGFDELYGPRLYHDHNYPDYFPQAASNPQPIRIYPVAALPEFRIWMQRTYVREKFPKYLESKVKKHVLPASSAEMLLLNATAPEPHYLESGVE